MVIHKTFQDFVLFLYVHMAMSDGGLHDAEERVILEKMEKLYPEGEDKKHLLLDAVNRYKTMDETFIQKTIKETFNHFGQVKFATKYKIYTDMFDIINADGVVDGSETKALAVLDSIIHLTAVNR